MTPTTELIQEILCYGATAAWLALLVVLLIRYFGEALGFLPGQPPLKEEAPRPLRAAAHVLLAFVLSRGLMLLAAYVYVRIAGNLQWYLHDFPSNWVRWDAPHYIQIAEEWYSNVGDDALMIVFYPLYPALMRLLSLTGLSATASGFWISNACLLGSGFAMHALVRHDRGEAAAARAVWLMMFNPLALFFSIPYSESLFFLLCVLTALAARKKRYLLAVLFGALCSATRSLGILVAPVVFFSMLQDAWQQYSLARGADARRRDPAFLGRAALCVVRVLPVTLGLIAYLLINYQVTGNALTFLTYQSEHWSQNFGSLFNTLSYSFRNALYYDSFQYRICLWIPQVISIVLVLALLWIAWRKHQPGDAAFAILYFYCAIAPTWLLSGPRYLFAMYALYPALAALTRRKWAFALTLAISVALFIYMSAQYIVAGYVL